MKLLSITDPKKDIDRVANTYPSRYEIHLENALSEPKTAKDLRPYIEADPYKDVLGKALELLESYHDLITGQTNRKMKLEEAIEVVGSLDTQFKGLTERKNALVCQRDKLKTSRDRMIPFAGPNYNVKEILRFRFIRFRFGHISREYCEKFSSYVYETIDTVIFKCEEEGDCVWVVYFVSENLADKIDAIYAFVHFERHFLPNEYEGIPVEAGHVPDDRIGSLQKEINGADREIIEAMSNRKKEFAAASRRIGTFSVSFDVRKMAVVTKHDTHNSYTLCEWVTERDAGTLQEEIERGSGTFYIIEGDRNSIMSTPPTKMKDPGLFRPFEMYVEMYGLSSYNKLDPIILIGITYSILFRFMLRDAGQRLCLLIGGFLLYRFKKTRLAEIISCCGTFSTTFELLFGGVFRFEDIVDAVWLRPQEAMINLLFIGRLNTVFVAAVTIGVETVSLCMILNVINSLHSHDTEKTYSDTNDVTGLVFYFAPASVIVLYMTDNLLPVTMILIIMLLIPLLAIFFKKPLVVIVEKKAGWMKTGLGVFIAQGIFELFEVLLNYPSNTLSFVCVGAFAMNHIVMVQMALMLVGARTGGNTNWAVVVGDNLFVYGMEGLIMGIQILRPEYYELFNRFYCGNGRALEPYGKAAGEQ